MIHTVKGFGIINKAEIDVFLELSCFFHAPADVGKHRRLRAGSLSTAQRSYPMFEVRGSSLECQAATAQERPRGATLRLRSEAAGRSLLAPRPGAVTLRSHPEPEARGGDLEEPPRDRGQGWQLGEATLGVVAAEHRRA